jgi:hypothetical protein
LGLIFWKWVREFVAGICSVGFGSLFRCVSLCGFSRGESGEGGKRRTEVESLFVVCSECVAPVCVRVAS